LIAGRSFGVTDFVNPSQLDKRSVVEVIRTLKPTSSRSYISRKAVATSQLAMCGVINTVCVRLQAIVEMTGGGVDYSFECIGVPSVMTDAFRCTKMVRFRCQLVHCSV
jgi:S-(hydroxymethyl)glutathione dehydrogenase / alcohol dehydrogenase